MEHPEINPIDPNPQSDRSYQAYRRAMVAVSELDSAIDNLKDQGGNAPLVKKMYAVRQQMRLHCGMARDNYLRSRGIFI